MFKKNKLKRIKYKLNSTIWLIVSFICALYFVCHILCQFSFCFVLFCSVLWCQFIVRGQQTIVSYMEFFYSNSFSLFVSFCSLIFRTILLLVFSHSILISKCKLNLKSYSSCSTHPISKIDSQYRDRGYTHLDNF